MNLTVEKLTNERQWRAVTGFTQSQFEHLLSEFEAAYLRRFEKSISERNQTISASLVLSTYSQLLLFTLFSLKTGMTYDCLGYACDMDGSTAKRNQQLGLDLLKDALSDLDVLPKREFKDSEEFEDYFAKHHTLILDATEQRIQRPGDNEEQKANYSGKKNATPQK